MRAVKIFGLTLLILIVIAEVGNRVTSFPTKEGSFFILLFWGSIISGIFTLLYVGNNSKTED